MKHSDMINGKFSTARSLDTKSQKQYRNTFLLKADVPTVQKEVPPKIIQEIISHNFGNKKPVISQCGPSTLHDVYKIQFDEYEYIIKINILNEYIRSNYFHTEKWIMKMLQKNNLPSLEVLTVDTSRKVIPYDYSIMAVAPGISFYEITKTSPIKNELLQKFGAVVGQMHKISTKNYGIISHIKYKENQTIAGITRNWKNHIIKNLEINLDLCVKYKFIKPETKKEILSLFKNYGKSLAVKQTVLLHGDLTNYNVFTDGKSITALIDWEDCLSGDPVYDLAFYGSGAFSYPEWFENFMKGYQKVQTLPEDFKLRYWLYFLRISIVKAVVRAKYGTVNAKLLPNVNMRIEKSIQELKKL